MDQAKTQNTAHRIQLLRDQQKHLKQSHERLVREYRETYQELQQARDRGEDSVVELKRSEIALMQTRRARLQKREAEIEVQLDQAVGELEETDRQSSADTYCMACNTCHEPEYPHVMTNTFKRYIRRTTGLDATDPDTYRHCKGLIREAVAMANRTAHIEVAA